MDRHAVQSNILARDTPGWTTVDFIWISDKEVWSVMMADTNLILPPVFPGPIRIQWQNRKGMGEEVYGAGAK